MAAVAPLALEAPAVAVPAVTAVAASISAPAGSAFGAAPTLSSRAALAAPASAADPAPAAPATVTDAPQSRRLSIQIPPLALLLPLAAVALYLLVTHLPAPRSASEGSREPVAAQAGISARVQESAETAGVPAAGTEDTAAEAEPAVAPELPSAELVRLRERAQQAAARAQQLSDARARVKVTLYYTDRCPHCSEAHGYFAAHGIHAEERDIDKDPRARARQRKLNSRGSLPTIEVEGQVLAGFDALQLERALDRAARARLRRGH